jgi:methionine-rich copper-binding protein CopC
MAPSLLKIILVTALLATAGTAHAHTKLTKAVPADNAVLAQAPAQLSLEFSKVAHLTAVTLQKEGAPASVKLGPLPKAASAALSVPMAPLGPGKYLVEWRVVGEDNHVMSGRLHQNIVKLHTSR